MRLRLLAAGARQLLVAGSQGITLSSLKDLAKIDGVQIAGGGLYMGAPHPASGARMGRSAADSVVGSDHRVHGMDNLYIADSSVFPDSTALDPSMTIMAFSYVAAKFIDEKLRRTTTH